MPVYVYECDSCNGRFEYTQSMSEPPKAVCETCGGKLQKIIVPIAFHLKGGGWYKDLYSSSKGAGDGKSSESKGDTKGESKGDSKGEGKSESKPETKSEPKGESKSESKSESKPSGGGSGSSGT